MTREEFISRRQDWRNKYSRTARIAFVLPMGFILAGAYIRSQTTLSLRESALPLSVIVGLLVYILFLVWYGIKLQRWPGRLCPHCGKVFPAQIALTTGKCGHCGANVFSGSASSS
jgi:hypothetical protein